ncbi:MAG: type II secretion system protein [Candidatus Microgenomates bacterium]|jgi:prepilin-type N-terminal cleavage/methylation domain-containing protein
MKKNIKGFTLIELLVVISIIGILVALFTVSFVSAQKQARDTQRKSDLSQYRNALESYANKNNGLYFPSAASTITSGLCSALVSSGFLTNTSDCPEDPKYANDNSYLQYHYQSNALATEYILWAKLESATNTYWIVCSTGQSGKLVSSETPSFDDAACPAGLTQ